MSLMWKYAKNADYWLTLNGKAEREEGRWAFISITCILQVSLLSVIGDGYLHKDALCF